MSESGTVSALITWEVPECPFAIDYSARVLDDIRLTVTDAFFSLPRGGAEIGGILLGKYNGRRLVISDYAALDCEHAYGPSFTISENDAVRLQDLLSGAPENFPGSQVVGWYHSHTRSGIFLSEADLDIHNRFFPEHWQIALVMKPHTFEPSRIGFFFREPDGSVHAAASYKEVSVEPQAMRPVPSGPPAETNSHSGSPNRERLRRSLHVEVETTAEPVVESPVAAAPAWTPAPESELPPEYVELEPEPERLGEEPVEELASEPPVPQFLTLQPAPPRRWVMVLLAAVIAIGAIAPAVKMRDLWLPKVTSAVRPVPTPVHIPPMPPPSLGLHAADQDGQLTINWDRSSLPVRQGKDAVLEISDGGPRPQSIALDPAHLQTGTFTYARQSEKVDVKLTVYRPDGPELREVTTFLGKLPERKPPPEDEAAKKQREEMAAQAAKLKQDMNWQVVKTKKLEKDLQNMREELRTQQQKRMANQAGEGKQ